MDWGYESDEINPKVSLAAPVQCTWRLVTDAKVLSKVHPASHEFEDTNGIGIDSQEKITFGGVQWNVRWKRYWDLYDGNLDDWHVTIRMTIVVRGTLMEIVPPSDHMR